MKVIENASSPTLFTFVINAVAEGAIVHTDAWQGYGRLNELGYEHHPLNQTAARAAGEDPGEMLPHVHRAISNLKTWLRGTHRFVSREHLQVYVDEFAFRFNRRRTPMAPFQPLLSLGANESPTTYNEIIRPPRRPGRCGPHGKYRAPSPPATSQIIYGYLPFHTLHSTPGDRVSLFY